MKTLITLGIAMLLSFANSAWACTSLAQGLDATALMKRLERINRQILTEKTELSEYTDHRFNWHQLRVEVGAEGNCNATFIEGRVNVLMDRGVQVCIYSADVSYVDYTEEKTTITQVGDLYCL